MSTNKPMKIAISSGHGKYVRGASGILDEVDEARCVVEAVAARLGAPFFHDDVSRSQSENLDTIVDWHNGQQRDLDVSVHFNAYVETTKPMGCEVLFVTQSSLADKLSAAIAEAGGFIDRGPKYRSDLYFLNCTHKPALLLEICFVDSEADALLYEDHFDEICEAIATTLS